MARKKWFTTYMHCPECAGELQVFSDTHLPILGKAGDVVRCPSCKWRGRIEKMRGSSVPGNLVMVRYSTRGSSKKKPQRATDKNYRPCPSTGIRVRLRPY